MDCPPSPLRARRPRSAPCGAAERRCALSWPGCGVEECLDEVGAFGLCEELAVVGVGVEVVEEGVELGEGSGGAVELDGVGQFGD